ncbi:MAG: acyltransferase, partial [Actinomycetota bacterium]
MVVDDARTTVRANPEPLISRVPYLPGLDAMRALAVVAVMLYHANSDWMPGGYLGVEMFFVISGYLITLLVIAERERTYRVSLRDFWIRRARRLLPALAVLLVGVTIWTVLFERDAVGQLRGDVIAGVFYGSNWYQLWVGLGYTADGDFAPLRHLWSLAVEEQFYLVWPLVMVLLLRKHGSRRIALTSRWLVGVALGLTALTALAYHPGVIGEPSQTPDAYWSVFGQPISKLDFAYIGSFSRASGILLGAALAMVWRPYALRRSTVGTAHRGIDLIAALALIGFGWMTFNVPLVTDAGAANGTLFRGGMLAASLLTLVVIAAVAHPTARMNVILDRNLLRWIGTRSYGLYLYHWPVYQAIRGIAGNKLTFGQFAFAMVVTVVLAEASYRLVETPVRERRFVATWRGYIGRSHRARRGALAGGAVLAATSLFAGATLATADVQVNEIEQSFQAADDDVVDLTALAEGDGDGATIDRSDLVVPDGDSRSVERSATTPAAPTTAAPTTVAPTTSPGSSVPAATSADAGTSTETDESGAAPSTTLAS